MQQKIAAIVMATTMSPKIRNSIKAPLPGISEGFFPFFDSSMAPERQCVNVSDATPARLRFGTGSGILSPPKTAADDHAFAAAPPVGAIID